MIYLDYAASTPIDPRVLDKMAPFHGAANPSSAHLAGRQAADAVEEARRLVARLIGGSPDEVVFTSGATESNNLAIGGVIRQAGAGHVVTTAAEHKAVLETARSWCPRTSIVPVRGDGSVDPDSVAAAIQTDTVLVSVMAANNEVGTISAIAEIGAVCREREVLFHCDAAQAVGKMHIDVGTFPVDLLSLSAHKMYGPKGVGALWVRRGVRDRIRPLIAGGGHERGLRSGTTNVAGCVGLGEAARIAIDERVADERHSQELRTHLLEALMAAFDGATVNGQPRSVLPGIVNVRLPGIDVESLLLATPLVAASTGSACTSAVPAPSHVLRAMGLSHEAAFESIRLSFGRFTTLTAIDHALEALAASVHLVRKADVESSVC